MLAFITAMVGMVSLFLKMVNAANGDGSIYSFVMVLFNDGSDPTAAPVRITPRCQFYGRQIHLTAQFTVAHINSSH